MQFLTNQEPVKVYRNFEEASGDVHSMCVIDIDEIDGLFPDFDLRVLNGEFIRSLRVEDGYVKLFDPHLPVTVGVVGGDEVVLESKGKNRLNSGFQLWVSDVTTHSAFIQRKHSSGLDRYIKELPIGTRRYIGPSDIQIWVLYNWLRYYVVTRLEGCFYDDDFTIPPMTDLFSSYQNDVQAIVMSKDLSKEDKEAGLENLKSFYFNRFGPFLEGTKKLRNWLAEEGELRLMGFHMRGRKIYITIGADTRVLAFHAMKEKIKPPCLAPIMS